MSAQITSALRIRATELRDEAEKLTASPERVQMKRDFADEYSRLADLAESLPAPGYVGLSVHDHAPDGEVLRP